MKLFFYRTPFNHDISAWDVSNGSDFGSMFDGNDSFNQDISSWNVENARFMQRMFYSADSFDQDLSSWCVPLISSSPHWFCYRSPIDNNFAVQPSWGGCETD